MNKYLKAVLPTTTQWVAFLALPAALTIFFLVSRYSNQFIQTQGIDYVAVQDNFLAQIFITGTLADFITRFMDFAFWGVLAAIGVVIAWGFSAAKTTVENHSIQSNFYNSNSSQADRSKGLFRAVILKAVSVGIMLYTLGAILVSAIPRLAASAAGLVQGLSVKSVVTISIWFAWMILLQALSVTSLRIFKIVRAD